jgi:hypothetical protein
MNDDVLVWSADTETLAITKNGTALLSAEISALTANELVATIDEAAIASVPAGPPTSRDLAEFVANASPTGYGPSPATAASMALTACVAEFTAGGDRSTFPSFPTTAWTAPDSTSFDLVYQVNIVPAHASVWTHGPAPALLWDVWKDVLDEADPRDHEPDGEALAQIEAARALLYADATTGAVSDTYRRYVELTEALAVVAMKHAELKLSGTVSEPELAESAAAVATAAGRLAVEGRQAEVEAAVQTIARYGSSRPTTLFGQARENFELVVNWRTDAASGSRYPETSFVPASFETAAWTPIQLAEVDIAQRATLADRYPALLGASLLDTGAADDGGRLLINGLRAEVALVAVRRDSWFSPDLLGLRAWRFTDPAAQPVSDGAVPASGRIPAFVVGFVLVRSLELDRVAENRLTFEEEQRLRQEHYDREYPAALARWEQLRLVDPRQAELEGVRVPQLVIPRYLPADPYLRPEICIAAFVCQLVPRSPDPDPALFQDG